MPLTTRCRHCSRLFPVHAQQLKERRGKVDCPQCGKRFDAIRGLLDEAIPGTAIPTDGSGRGGSTQSAVTAPADMLDLSDGRERAGWARPILWSLGILFLIAGLILQIGWWDRGKWMQYPQVLVTMQAVCKMIGCSPKLPRVMGTMEVLRPALIEQGEAPGNLRLTLILVNRAAVRQRLPQLQLELYDEKGKLVAARRFGSDQYLNGENSQAGLQPDAAVRPTLDLVKLPVPAAAFRVRLF